METWKTWPDGWRMLSLTRRTPNLTQESQAPREPHSASKLRRHLNVYGSSVPHLLRYGWVGGVQVSLFCTFVCLLGIPYIQYIQQYCVYVGKHHCIDYRSKTCLSYRFQPWDSELYLIPGSEGLKCSGYNRDFVPLGKLKTVTGQLMFMKREHSVVRVGGGILTIFKCELTKGFIWRRMDKSRSKYSSAFSCSP